MLGGCSSPLGLSQPCTPDLWWDTSLETASGLLVSPHRSTEERAARRGGGGRRANRQAFSPRRRQGIDLTCRPLDDCTFAHRGRQSDRQLLRAGRAVACLL